MNNLYASSEVHRIAINIRATLNNVVTTTRKYGSKYKNIFGIDAHELRCYMLGKLVEAQNKYGYDYEIPL
jgi:hypothetical protein